jgi:DNA-binding winged helix-turn-helix (wHTH) protein
MLKLADLAGRADFDLGPLHVSPARRLIEGPAGSINVEPIVMKVFLLLLDAAGNVVTRDELFGNAWGGVFVGDDSLNRAIAQIRKIASGAAPGSFEIETIPRTGYRLSGPILDALPAPPSFASGERTPSRRAVVGGGLAAAATIAGAGLWLNLGKHRTGERFDALMRKGDDAFRDGTALDDASVAEGTTRKMIDLYAQAVQLDPRSARAWGLLGYFSAAASDEALPASASLLAQAQEAIRRALDIDKQEPNARVAMLLLQSSMLDWTSRDRQLRAILATDPANLPAMSELMPLLQAAGFTRESWSWNERILHASPLARAFLVIRSMKLWILGDVAGSDKVIDRVRGLWPSYDFAFLVRLMLFTLTDRPKAALAMIDGAGARALPHASFWRAAANALDTRSPQAIEAARQSCVDAATQTPWQTNMAVMILCALGLTDAAFELTNGYLLWRGRAVSGGQAAARDVDDYSRRMTQWLFTPPAAVMRADPRFLQICDEFGLTAYWRTRHVRPDYQIYR